MRVGYFLSCEEFGPDELVRQAQLAEQAGFESLWISDHFHPWIDAQGNSPFVWSVIGALSQVTTLPVTTAVTCPTMRVHPAVVAQAAATSSVLLDGRFALGVGSGEALNEHILGSYWPPTDVRLEMLEEAVDVMRKLWTGETVSHRGRHYTVEQARLYTIPDKPVPVYVSGFGAKSQKLASRIGDGFVTTRPDPDTVTEFRNGDGRTCQAGTKVCWSRDKEAAKRRVHRSWPNEGLSGELAQELRSPKHFEQACALVTEDMATEHVPCGDDVREHVEHLAAFQDAGFDVVHVAQIGPEQEGFFDFYANEVIPALAQRHT